MSDIPMRDEDSSCSSSEAAAQWCSKTEQLDDDIAEAVGTVSSDITSMKQKHRQNLQTISEFMQSTATLNDERFTTILANQQELMEQNRSLEQDLQTILTFMESTEAKNDERFSTILANQKVLMDQNRSLEQDNKRMQSMLHLQSNGRANIGIPQDPDFEPPKWPLATSEMLIAFNNDLNELSYRDQVVSKKYVVVLIIDIWTFDPCDTPCLYKPAYSFNLLEY